MPNVKRPRPVNASQVRAYLTKANEYLDAAVSELEAGRAIAATSLAIHAAINSADVVTGARLGRRAASQAHEQVLSMLAEAGIDGTEVAKELARLLSLKTRPSTRPTPSPGQMPRGQSSEPRGAYE